MNAENFSSFLQDPSKLYQIPYQELKSLVVQYPYCQPLRILLLQKSQIEQHPDYERNLQMAAAYLPDRRLLYLLVREFQALDSGKPLFELEEERLELKALSEILADREPRIVENTGAESPSSDPIDLSGLFQAKDATPPVVTPPPPPPPVDIPQPLAPVEEQENPEEQEETAPEPPEETPGMLAEQQAQIEALFEEVEDEEEEEVKEEKAVAEKEKIGDFREKKRPAPMPKSAFSSWDARYSALRSLLSLDAFDLPAVTAPARPEPEKQEEEAPMPQVQAQDLARQSVTEKDGIVSETLAELLLRQGHTQKAIAMYEKLSLIFPEKSTFFAQKIELLKRK